MLGPDHNHVARLILQAAMEAHDRRVNPITVHRRAVDAFMALTPDVPDRECAEETVAEVAQRMANPGPTISEFQQQVTEVVRKAAEKL